MNKGRTPGKTTIAIASGKGGVGKTVITANLALALARKLPDEKDSVVALDLDLGGGNLNSCLGVRSPNGTIDSLFLNKVPGLQSLLTPTGEKKLKIVCGSYSGSPESRLNETRKQALLKEIDHLNASFLLMDLGAGTSSDVLDLFLSAREKIVVVTPESLSLHNAFVFLKSALLHYLWYELEKEDFLVPVKSSLQKMVTEQELLDLPGLIEQLKSWDRYAAYVLSGLIDDLHVKFLVNMYRGGVEKSHLERFHHLLFKHLHVRNNVDYLGFIHFDYGIPASVQAVKPFLLRYPGNRAAKDFTQIASRLANQETLKSPPVLPFPEKRSWIPQILRRGLKR